MSEATHFLCREFVHAGEPMDVFVKGRAERVRVREALGIPGLGKVVPRQDVRKSPRVPVSLPLEYRTLSGKVVETWASRGTVRDIGYHGLLAEVRHPLLLHGELKLAFELPDSGFKVKDVYARVVSRREADGRPLAGVEFTSLGTETEAEIKLFVQKAVQEASDRVGQ
jgi:adenylate cyclase